MGRSLASLMGPSHKPDLSEVEDLLAIGRTAAPTWTQAEIGRPHQQRAQTTIAGRFSRIANGCIDAHVGKFRRAIADPHDRDATSRIGSFEARGPMIV